MLTRRRLILLVLLSAPAAYAAAPAAPKTQTAAQASAQSFGCVTCHSATDQHTMHRNPAVVLGCADCHGGNPLVAKPAGSAYQGSAAPAYRAALDRAHVQPHFPQEWKYPSSATPPAAYTLLNRESPEFVRFINPGDYRIAREACGACHLPIIQAAERSLM